MANTARCRSFLTRGGRPATPPEARAVVRSFERGTLPEDEWTHRAHCLVGVVYLLRHPAPRALAELRTAIRRYNASVGVRDTDDSGYHETLTRTFVDGLASFLVRHAACGLEQGLLDALWRDPVSSFDYALARYTPERLWGVTARRSYLPPDRSPGVVGE